MSSYIGRHAEWYDTIYADKPYQQEAGFVHDLLQKFSEGRSRRLLEMACGTGTHALAFERLGYDVTAFDYSDDMIAVALQKAKSERSGVRFDRADMRSIPSYPVPFDAVVCLFDSIGYVKTNEAIEKVLTGVRQSLRTNGLFIFEFWHAAAMVHGYSPTRVRRWQLPDGVLLRVSETKLVREQQLAEVAYDIYKLNSDGTYSNVKEIHLNRYFLAEEMNLLLTRSSFVPLKFFAGFAADEKLDENVWHVVAVARKASQEGEINS